MVWRLMPYEWLENQQYNQYVNPAATEWTGTTNYWYLDLIDGETAGITNVSIDSRLEKRFTSYKYLKEGKDPVAGTGGEKLEHRQVRYKDRERENMDLIIQGWFDGTDAQSKVAQLDYFAKKSDLCVLVAQNEFTWLSGAWGFGDDDPVAGDYSVIDDMEDSTDWIAGAYGAGWNNGNVDVLTTDNVEGLACIRYEETSAAGNTDYGFRYNPSTDIRIYDHTGDMGGWIHFWLKSSKASTDWQEAVLFVVDNAPANTSTWNLLTLSDWNANTWTEIELDLDDRLPGTPANYFDINYVDWRFKTEVADTADFDLRLDIAESYTPAIRKHDIPFFVVESVQTQKRGGRDTCRFEYNLKLKRIRSPPRK